MTWIARKRKAALRRAGELAQGLGWWAVTWLALLVLACYRAWRRINK